MGRVDQAAISGCAYFPAFLGSAELGQLQGLPGELHFKRAKKRVGRVCQEADIYSVALDRFPDPNPVHRLSQCLSAAASDSPLAPWRPNEVTWMRYRGPGEGISAHRDRRRYLGLIAVFSLSGLARFEVLPSRQARRASHTYICRSGDLILMRGADPDDNEEKRPFHRVRSLGCNERISLTLRMDSLLEF